MNEDALMDRLIAINKAAAPDKEPPKSLLGPLELKLLQLRDLTDRFAVMDDLQLIQLRLWPFAVDPSLDNNKASVDFDSFTVIFEWTKKAHKPDKKYNARLSELEAKVRFLLGSHWKIQILCNGKTIFNSKDVVRNKPNPNRSRTRRKKRVGKPARRR